MMDYFDFLQWPGDPPLLTPAVFDFDADPIYIPQTTITPSEPEPLTPVSN